MTATHIAPATAQPTLTPVEHAEASILRTLADADGAPVPLAELDSLPHTRQTIAAALARLTRAGLLDVHAGHLSLATARTHRAAAPASQAGPAGRSDPPAAAPASTSSASPAAGDRSTTPATPAQRASSTRRPSAPRTTPGSARPTASGGGGADRSGPTLTGTGEHPARSATTPAAPAAPATTTPAAPLPTPPLRAILALVIAAVADSAEPPTTSDIQAALPASLTAQVPTALTLGTATGVLGQRRQSGQATWFVAPPRASGRARTRGGKGRGAGSGGKGGTG